MFFTVYKDYKIIKKLLYIILLIRLRKNAISILTNKISKHSAKKTWFKYFNIIRSLYYKIIRY